MRTGKEHMRTLKDIEIFYKVKCILLAQEMQAGTDKLPGPVPFSSTVSPSTLKITEMLCANTDDR